MRLRRTAIEFSGRSPAGRTICFSVIFLSIMCACLYAATSSPSYDRLEGLFLEGQFESVVSEANWMIDRGYGRKDEIYYLKGLGELKLNRFEDARNSFGWIISKYPNSRKAFDAYIGAGDSYMLAGELNDAVVAYNRILDGFRSNKNLPVVYSRLESCYKGLGLREKADYYHKMSVEASPLSFDLKGQAAVARPAVKNAGRQSSDNKQVRTAPVSNISPKTKTQISADSRKATAPATMGRISKTVAPASSGEPEDMDLVMATGRAVSVQVGSFKNRKNAEKLAQKLAAAGYESRVEIPVAQLDKFYRVKVGRLYSQREAEALKARLKESGCNTKICDGETCE